MPFGRAQSTDTASEITLPCSAYARTLNATARCAIIASLHRPTVHSLIPGTKARTLITFLKCILCTTPSEPWVNPQNRKAQFRTQNPIGSETGNPHFSDKFKSQDWSQPRLRPPTHDRVLDYHPELAYSGLRVRAYPGRLAKRWSVRCDLRRLFGN
jgi:hypothetical protein